MAKTTIEFSETSSRKLDSLSKKLSITKADVLRGALALYSYLDRELHASGEKQLAIVDEEDAVEKIVVVPGLQRKDVVEVQRKNRQTKSLIAVSGSGD